MSLRKEKVSELVRRLAAAWIAREAGPQSLITVTRCDITPSFRTAALFLTVLPQSQEDSVIRFLTRRLPELREYVKKNMRTKTVPFLSVEIDKGEKNRQRIDEISRTA